MLSKLFYLDFDCQDSFVISKKIQTKNWIVIIILWWNSILLVRWFISFSLKRYQELYRDFFVVPADYIYGSTVYIATGNICAYCLWKGLVSRILVITNFNFCQKISNILKGDCALYRVKNLHFYVIQYWYFCSVVTSILFFDKRFLNIKLQSYVRQPVG